uniref:Uncharacterized protein n=1 Tax=Arundo donax TaxID=35708 RepID=A0A0A9BQW2_ARUDO
MTSKNSLHFLGTTVESHFVNRNDKRCLDNRCHDHLNQTVTALNFPFFSSIS